MQQMGSYLRSILDLSKLTVRLKAYIHIHMCIKSMHIQHLCDLMHDYSHTWRKPQHCICRVSMLIASGFGVMLNKQRQLLAEELAQPSLHSAEIHRCCLILPLRAELQSCCTFTSAWQWWYKVPHRKSSVPRGWMLPSKRGYNHICSGRFYCTLMWVSSHVTML